MIKHIIIWNFKEGLSDSEKVEYAQKIKEGLESLKGHIHGLLDICVRTEFLPSSNGDLMLESSFISEEGLENYQKDSEHLKIAEFVRSVTDGRRCVDYND